MSTTDIIILVISSIIAGIFAPRAAKYFYGKKRREEFKEKERLEREKTGRIRLERRAQRQERKALRAQRREQK